MAVDVTPYEDVVQTTSAALTESTVQGRPTTVTWTSEVVVLGGRPVQEYNPVWLRRQIGTVTQDPVLFDMSVKENLEYAARGTGRTPTEEDLRAALQA